MRDHEQTCDDVIDLGAVDNETQGGGPRNEPDMEELTRQQFGYNQD